MNESISVIIPTYNRADKLKRAVDSVLNQTYQNFEIIIIDDNSQDNTRSVVKNFKDDRIRYFRNKKNLGGAGARNVGIRKAKYKYLAFLDDDDEWLYEKLEKQINILSKTNPSFCGVYTGLIKVRNGNIISEKIGEKEGCLFKHLLWKNIVGSTSVIMLKKRCVKDVGGFKKGLPASQERELYLRLSQKYKFRCISEPLVKYYIHPDEQITGDYKKKLISTKYIYNKYLENIKKHQSLHSKYLYNLSSLELVNGNIHRAKKYFKKALSKNPFSFKHFFKYSKSYKYYKMMIKNLLIDRRDKTSS